VLGHLFAGERRPECSDAADAHDDGALDISDAITVLGHLFGGYGPLSAPFELCGGDPTPDKLSCEDCLSCRTPRI